MKKLQLTMNHWIWGSSYELHEFHHIPMDFLIQISLAIGFSARTARHPAAQKWEWEFDEDLRFWDVGNPWKSPVQGWKCKILQEKQSTMIILAVLSLGSYTKLRCVIRPMDQPTWQLLFSMEKSWLNPPFRGWSWEVPSAFFLVA